MLCFTSFYICCTHPNCSKAIFFSFLITLPRGLMCSFITLFLTFVTFFTYLVFDLIIYVENLYIYDPYLIIKWLQYSKIYLTNRANTLHVYTPILYIRESVLWVMYVLHIDLALTWYRISAATVAYSKIASSVLYTLISWTFFFKIPRFECFKIQ